MQLVTATAFAFLFSLHAGTDDDIWKWSADLEWIKNKWTLESPVFGRSCNATDPLSSTNISFKLFYHKWEACNPSASTPAGSSSPPDPRLCGIDLEASRILVRCSLYDDGRIGEKPNTKPMAKVIIREPSTFLVPEAPVSDTINLMFAKAFADFSGLLDGRCWESPAQWL